MIQILNNLRTLRVARLCANFHEGTLTKGRKKPSLHSPCLATLPGSIKAATSLAQLVSKKTFGCFT